MTTEALVIDCDGHILEPPDLWETYLEPANRDRALRIPRRRRRLRVSGDRRPALHHRASGPARNPRRNGQARRRGAGAPGARDAGGGRSPRGPRDPSLVGADLSSRSGIRHHGHEGARAASRPRGHGQRVVVLGWIGYFLDRADATFTGTPLGATVRLKEKPSYYFKRQCFISADPDERAIAALMPHVGEDKFFWASDYPRLPALFGVATSISPRTACATSRR